MVARGCLCAGDDVEGVDGQEVRGSSLVHLVFGDAESAAVDALAVAVDVVVGVDLAVGEFLFGTEPQVGDDVGFAAGELPFQSHAGIGVEVAGFADVVQLVVFESELSVVAVDVAQLVAELGGSVQLVVLESELGAAVVAAQGPVVGLLSDIAVEAEI